MSLVSRIRARRRLRSLRPVMRGYQRLRAEGQLARVARLREALTTARLEPVSRRASSLVFGAGSGSAELVARQFVLTRFGGLSLNKALLTSVERRGPPVAHPLPAEWRELLEEHGFRVAKLRSALEWYLYLLLYLASGILGIGRRALAGVLVTLRPAQSPGRHVHFDALTQGNLPQPADDGRSYDVMTWYQQWPGRVRDLDAICHQVRGVHPSTAQGTTVASVPAIVPPLQGWRAVGRFLGWGIAAIGVAAASLLTGRWWHPLLLNEASAAASVRLQPPDRLAREYLFHNSAWIYRPLWTYEAERMGSRISLYFYSTNCETFRQQEEYPPISFGYSAMNWPRYLVWDEYQADFVRRAVGMDANVIIVGPISFQDGTSMPSALPPRTLAVFDVQPLRDSYYQTLGLELEYYLPEVSRRFLTDIADATREIGAQVAFKRKREVGNLAHPKYRRFLERFHALPHVLAIPPATSANRVIEQSAAVISMAFTSTALIGRHLGIPSAYYDPTGLLHRDDRAAHGVEILRGPSELRTWLASALGSQSRAPAPMESPSSRS
ncbi:MAG: polysaccharide biosynthesis PFTS motif protein [Gemmatimonadota bacterium]|nr:polysaccharide biosynthesis PFTS motif protein [Gemmatimonadota bacterium]